MVIRLNLIWLTIIFTSLSGHPQQISFSSMSGPYGGNLGDVAVISDGELFVSSYNSEGKGIYKSSDSGFNWQLLPPLYPDNEIFALGTNKNDVLFAGSGYYSGLFRSTDKGNSWIRLSEYTQNECWVIAFNDSNHIFAGDGDWGGLMRSTDNGDTWTQLLPNSITPLSIAVDNLGIVYVGTSNNFYKSKDNGMTWNSYYSGLPSLEIPSVICNKQNEIFVGTGYILQGDGVYYSNNGGANWFQRGLLGQTVYSLALDDNSGNIYAATKESGVFKSSNNGISWEQINNGLYNYNIFRVKIAPNNLLFACSESQGGIYRSSDFGENWEITGVSAGTTNRAVISRTGDIYAATFCGIQKFSLINNKWSILGLTMISSVPGWNWLSDIIEDSSGIFFASSWAGKIYKSSNNGNSWDTTSAISDIQTHISDLSIYGDNSVLASTFDYIKRSTNNGNTWSTIKNGLPNPIISNVSNTVEGVIYAISQDKLCRTSNIDSPFVIIKDGVYSSLPPIYNRIAVGGNGLIFFADKGINQGLYRSTDYGETWIKIYGNLVSSISFYNDHYLIAGLPSGQGLLFSSDRGTTWLNINQGLPYNAQIIWNQIDSYGYLYAAADGLGLYKSNSIVVDVNERKISSASTFELFQNFPNPFNSNTNIKYEILQASRVVVKVYDLMGNEVVTLINRYQEAGSYDLMFQADDLASGIYFYQLQASEFIATKKLILLK